jgi:hypothetical protein
MLLLVAHPISQWAYRVGLSGVVSRCTRGVTHYAGRGRHAKAVFRYPPAHGPRCRAQLRVLEPRQTAQRSETVKGRGALADGPVRNLKAGVCANKAVSVFSRRSYPSTTPSAKVARIRVH